MIPGWGEISILGIFSKSPNVMGMSQCDSTWGPNGGAMKIFEVLGCFREKYWKVILVKNEWRRGGEKFEVWGCFPSFLKVVRMWLFDSILGRDSAAMKIFGVLGRLREKYWKWFWWQINDRGMGRNLNFRDILKVPLRWWECNHVIGPWILILELWRSLGFWVF